MSTSVQTAVMGATIRQIVDAGDGANCAAHDCGATASWVVFQEHCDGQDDYDWYACDAHLSAVAVEAIDFQDDD